jgi:hypothetical protein
MIQQLKMLAIAAKNNALSLASLLFCFFYKTPRCGMHFLVDRNTIWGGWRIFLVGLSDIFGPMFSDCCSLEM